MKTINFLVTGVGGQGTLLASDVVALVGVTAGHDVKKSEIHGMAQRGGSVTSQVRWGPKVFSPMVGQGEVDFYLGLEKLEALRHISYLRPGGVVLVSDYVIPPVGVSLGLEPSLESAQMNQEMAKFTDRLYLLPAIPMAEALGNARTNNVVMLGALSAFLDVPEATWLQVISQRVPPRSVEVNERAFAAGRVRVLQELAPIR